MQSSDQLTVDTLRALCADMIQKANSGHPGLPLGAAPAAYSVWHSMKHNPKHPNFADRDRFVLSAGHGSSMLYGLLHLFNYDIDMNDLQQFRQPGSKTPGHPEYGHTIGIEATTGPLGQGIAHAVGMAWAESYLAAKFNRPGCEIVNHHTYALCGDGCMMEGIAAEAASLAGTLALHKLIVLYDSNKITIEGSTDLAFCENVAMRFEAYGWDVQTVGDGNDLSAIATALEKARKSNKPSLIEIKTQIGYGAPNKMGKASAHGEPLGADEIRLMKENLGLSSKDFYVPDEVRAHMSALCAAFAESENSWNILFTKYKEQYHDEAREWELWHSEELPDLLNSDEFWSYEGNLATRVSSEQVLNKLSKLVPNLIGGSADLAPSTKTVMKDREHYSKENRSGSNLHFGIREHAMAAIANGMALHGGLRPYVSGFLVFSDYMKPSMRLAAMMELPVINIMTHDSIGVGEDGPTHQPIEQLAMLRAIPNFTVMRPCDSHETAAAWYLALTRTHSPSLLALSRQNLMLLPETGKDAIQGGYILRDSENPRVILMASGSEVALAYKAYDALKARGIHSRVVSMMSFEVFEEQSLEYKQSVLPREIKARVAIEALSSFGWHKYVGTDGVVIAMEGFGASAPAGELFEKFGFTVENIVEKAMGLLK